MSVAPTLERPTAPAVEIDTAVSPSLHPQNLLSLPDYGEDTAPAISVAVDAMRALYDGLSDVHRAREAAEKDPTLTPAARLLKVASFAEQHQNAITRKFDKAHSTMTTAIDALNKSLSEPLKLRGERPGIANEVRQYVKALTTAQREAWFTERQRAGDMESLEIVLGAPGYLSGLSDDERVVRTKFLHRLRHPVEARRLDIMTKALDMIHTRGPLLWKEMERAVGASPAKVQRLREAKNSAEAAFILRGDKTAA